MIRLAGLAAPVKGPLACADVERKRVRSPEAWRGSSFRWLELGRQEQESLAVDDWRELRGTRRIEA
ncbi:MAG: hypothetical protein HS116_02640 [Planctomycetes bacterium]|nr:hypothetical protein [Planctomycetota bacterium]